MLLTYDSLKNLLDNSQSVSLPDSIPLEVLLRIAEAAKKENKHFTIRVKTLGVEDLKRISKAADGKISFYVENIQE